MQWTICGCGYRFPVHAEADIFKPGTCMQTAPMFWVKETPATTREVAMDPGTSTSSGIFASPQEP
jgi:hypothetical protein